MATPLPTSRPSAQGVDARGVLALLDALEEMPDVDPHSLVVLRHGQVVSAGWWAPYSPERPQLLYSLSKSFTATAVGLAVAEGLLGLDDAVVDHFPEFAAEITDPRSRSIRVRHVLAMASGHREDTWERAVAVDAAEPVRGFLLLPPECEPGSVFAYNQPCTYSLAAIVQRASGQTLTGYLRTRLFDPLGIGPVGWSEHPTGRQLGFSGLHAPTDAIARLGQLHLQHGAWDGRQLLSRDWVAEATRTQVANAGSGFGSPDWEQGYGYQFWQSRHGYRGDGAYGQFCLVLPGQDAVVAVTAQTPDLQGVLDAVWEHLLPAFRSAEDMPDDGADAALADRLSRLTVPAVAASPAPATDGGRWAGAAFTPAGGTCAQQPTLLGVDVAEADSGWRVGLREDAGQLDLELGTGGWAVTDHVSSGDEAVPAAVSGGWLDAARLRFDVIFLETPHRLEVVASLPDRTFEAHWVTAPLHGGSLRSLRCPRPAR